jgi:hypothetical protein
MTSLSSEVFYSVNRKRHPGVAAARWRRRRLVQIFLVVALVAAVTVSWLLYNRPAHSYQVSAHSAVWTADVKFALSENGSGSPVPVVGPLRHVPGVGKIVEVIVDKFPSRKGSAVLFLTGVGINDAGLVYLNGYPAPPDSCNVHLSGPWWEVSPLNDRTMSCDRGFHFTAGG